MKICNKCAVPKEESSFEKGRGTCKRCRQDQKNSAYPSRREYLTNYAAEKRKDPKFVQEKRDNRSKYREEENARNREYYEKNKEEINRKKREARRAKGNK